MFVQMAVTALCDGSLMITEPLTGDQVCTGRSTNLLHTCSSSFYLESKAAKPVLVSTQQYFGRGQPDCQALVR